MSSQSTGIRPGIHPATIGECVFRRSQNGNLYISVALEVEGSVIYGQLYLTDKAMRMARAQVKAMGFDPDKRNLEELYENPKLLEGNQVEIEVVEEVYKGEARIKVNRIGAPDVPPKPSELSNLTKALRSAKKKDGPEAQPAPVDDDPDEEVPF